MWEMIRYPWASNPNIYSVSYSRKWEFVYGDLISNITWPEDKAVREMSYDVSPGGKEGKGSIVGFCGTTKLACLNGTVEI